MEIYSERIQTEQDILAVRDRARVICEEMGFTVPQQLQVNTSVFELGKNLVEHGGGGQIAISITTDEDNSIALEITGHDEGAGFSEKEIEELLSAKSTKTALRGIPAMKRLMDEMSIESSEDGGTTFTLIKRKTSNKSITQNIVGFFQEKFSSPRNVTLSDELQLQNTNLAQSLSLYEEKNQELAKKNNELLIVKKELEASNDELQERSLELQEAVLNLGDRTAELELNNRRFDAVMRNVSERIVITDRSGQVVMANQAFCDRMGQKGETLCELSSVNWRMFLGKLADEPGEQWNKRFTEIESNPDKTFDFQIKNPHEGKTVACHTLPIRNDEGKGYGRLWIFTAVK